MLSVTGFCGDFRADWKWAKALRAQVRLQDGAKVRLEHNIRSLIWRAGGVVSGVVSLSLASISAFVVFSSAVTALISGVAAAIFVVLARECVVIGCHMRIPPPKADVSNRSQSFKDAKDWISKPIPTDPFEGTWIVGPLVRSYKTATGR